MLVVSFLVVAFLLSVLVDGMVVALTENNKPSLRPSGITPEFERGLPQAFSPGFYEPPLKPKH